MVDLRYCFLSTFGASSCIQCISCRWPSRKSRRVVDLAPQRQVRAEDRVRQGPTDPGRWTRRESSWQRIRMSRSPRRVTRHMGAATSKRPLLTSMTTLSGRYRATARSVERTAARASLWSCWGSLRRSPSRRRPSASWVTVMTLSSSPGPHAVTPTSAQAAIITGQRMTRVGARFRRGSTNLRPSPRRSRRRDARRP